MRTLVAMSGGVDSSTVAALLSAQGREVVGVTLRMREGGADDSAISDAAEVARSLGIEHRVVDVRRRFATCVVDRYTDDFERGVTPNPCTVCNPQVKFDALLGTAEELGCDLIATGHYARIVSDGQGRSRLMRPLDPRKDQSYFLYRVTPDVLARVEFPLGESTKDEVRARAAAFGLAVADKPESQDLCFAAQVPTRPSLPGEIVDAQGRVLGSHSGIEAFTVGQRKGIGIAAAHPLYVLAIDAPRNRAVVGAWDDLARSTVMARDVVWHGTPSAVDQEVLVQLRSNMEPLAGGVSGDSDTLTGVLDRPAHGIAPGQSVVCYQNDTVLCGGIIT